MIERIKRWFFAANHILDWGWDLTTVQISGPESGTYGTDKVNWRNGRPAVSGYAKMPSRRQPSRANLIETSI